MPILVTRVLEACPLQSGLGSFRKGPIGIELADLLDVLPSGVSSRQEGSHIVVVHQSLTRIDELANVARIRSIIYRLEQKLKTASHLNIQL
jgi:hypothetical protein